MPALRGVLRGLAHGSNLYRIDADVSLLSPFKRYFQGVLVNVHDQFKAAVMESRKLSQAQVDAIADGRIFTGEQAKELGLIDGLGNLEDAIKKASELGGIKGEPEVLWPRKKYSFFEEFGTQMADQILNHVLAPRGNPIWYLEPGISQ